MDHDDQENAQFTFFLPGKMKSENWISNRLELLGWPEGMAFRELHSGKKKDDKRAG